MDRFQQYTDLQPNVLVALLAVFAFLTVATIIVAFVDRKPDAGGPGELTARVRTWWVIVVLITLALALGVGATILFLAFVSFLALKEYFSIIPTRRIDRRVLFWAYLAIIAQYYWIYDAWYGMFIIFVPIYIFVVLPLRMVTLGQTDRFLAAVGTLYWGVMLAVYGLSHLGYFLVLPAEGNPVAGGPGVLLFLLFLTEINDVAQFFWGKLFGRHAISPTVSPNKTWEGFAGGVITTTALAFVIAPYLTPHAPWQAIAAGAIISVFGFFGDLTISAVKRDLKIKDTGTTLPGHGGILDRVDSLLFTAPLYFHFTYYFHY